MDMAGDVLQPEGEDAARIAWNLRRTVTKYQETFSVIEKVSAPDYHPEKENLSENVEVVLFL